MNKNGAILILSAILFFACSSKKQLKDFQKITFHTSECFGNCPVINLQVNNDMSVLISKKKYSRIPKLPTEISEDEEFEYFKGKLDKNLYDKLLTELAKIDTLNFGDQKCCDGSMKTIIAYYNGKRKVVETMFPPESGKQLISILYEISKSKDLAITNEKFEIE